MNVNELNRIQEQQLESASLNEHQQQPPSQKKELRREQKCKQQRESRAKQSSETPEDYEKKKELRREQQRESLAKQSPEDYEKKKEIRREKKRESRAKQSSENNEKFKEQQREYKRKSRAQQTPEEHENERELNLNRERKAVQTHGECPGEQTQKIAAEVPRSKTVIPDEDLINADNHLDISKYQRNEKAIYDETAKMLSIEHLTYSTCAVCDRCIAKYKTSLHSITPKLIHVSLRKRL